MNHPRSRGKNRGYQLTAEAAALLQEQYERRHRFSPEGKAEMEKQSQRQDLSFDAHDDATSDGCQMCGNEWKSLNTQGYCSSCWTIWNS